MYPNGTIIPPAAEGPMRTKEKKRSHSRDLGNLFMERSAACTSGSCKSTPIITFPKPDSNLHLLTIAALCRGRGRRQRFLHPPSGRCPKVDRQRHTGDGSSIAITKERSVSFTQSLDAGLNFDDIVNIGVSFSVTEETSSSKAYQSTVPSGETGYVAFTGTLTCSEGTGTCNGGSLHGEICTLMRLCGS
jgi:hypothetical protein